MNINSKIWLYPIIIGLFSISSHALADGDDGCIPAKYSILETVQNEHRLFKEGCAYCGIKGVKYLFSKDPADLQFSKGEMFKIFAKRMRGKNRGLNYDEALAIVRNKIVSDTAVIDEASIVGS